MKQRLPTKPASAPNPSHTMPGIACDHFVTTLRVYSHHFAIAWRPPCDHITATLQPHWRHLATTLQAITNQSAAGIQSTSDHFWPLWLQCLLAEIAAAAPKTSLQPKPFQAIEWLPSGCRLVAVQHFAALLVTRSLAIVRLGGPFSLAHRVWSVSEIAL